ncbi:MAG: hypothetical protein U9R25_07740 [Chloroflexota bacterium]|nr:hypothetical protein [Chloroflexota bacterium]
MTETGKTRPDYVIELEEAYGAPSQEGFGSAVFFERLKENDELAEAALKEYQFFVGDLWQRYGEDAWMGPWKEVYSRQPDTIHDILAELRGMADPDAAMAVEMILENVDNPEQARLALVDAFDDPAVTELKAFNLGDGEAMAGILVAGRRPAQGEGTFLVFLMD